MYYEEQGAGTPLVLLHGGLGAVQPGARAGWSALLPMLTARFRTLSVEHRGHGRTDNPAGLLSYDLIADDIARFIERLDLAPVHLAGVSDGAIAGLSLARKHPELLRSLIAVGANYRVDEHVRDALAFFDPDVLERDSPDLARMLAARHDVHHHPGYWRDLTRAIRRMAEREPAWTESDLSLIMVPTLLIAGEKDFFVDLDQTLAMRRAIPDSELLIINHGGLDGLANHLPQFSRPDVVGPVVVEFLDRHNSSAEAKQR
jgi:pimeloyl-ACP methyl ester carboxylesterase